MLLKEVNSTALVRVFWELPSPMVQVSSYARWRVADDDTLASSPPEVDLQVPEKCSTLKTGVASVGGREVGGGGIFSKLCDNVGWVAMGQRGRGEG